MQDQRLARLHRSLYEWAFADIKTAADSLPRLSFVGLCAWIDTMTYLVSGDKPGLVRWKRLLGAYLPEYLEHDGARRLYVGLRCKLLHEYGPLHLLLTHLPPEKIDVWLFPKGDTLSLPRLIEDFEGAYARFRQDLESNERLREGVLRRGESLLAQTDFEIAPAQAASASGDFKATRIGQQRTRPPEIPFDDQLSEEGGADS